jgi:plastocyanin
MAGSLQVVPATTAASTASSVQSAAAAQAAQDTSGALAAETAASATTNTVDASGHRTVTATAGAATPNVEIAEFLPGQLSIGVGDNVHWVTRTIKDIHTVTFPSGTHAADVLPAVCEGSGSTDPPLAGPPTSCPGGPANFETHLVPGPFGSNTISSTSQVASSGLLANPPAPFPGSVTYTFNTAGSFSLFCHIHENAMKASVLVQAASTVATPVTAQPHFTG